MKAIYLFILLLFISLYSFGQQNFNSQTEDEEVGVIEHLGENIPLDLKFVNEKDSLVTLRSLITKPTVISFVYFDCPGLCSPLLDGVSEVIEKSDLELGKEYQVITVSFNFRDTPEKARAKKQTFLRTHSKSHASAWMFLTGDSTNIYTLSNAIGFKFKRAGLDFIHPSAIMIISPNGKITRYLYGLSFLPLDFKMAIFESQKEQSRPSINKVYEFCYTYDPAGKRYALDITKVTGILILFILFLFLSVLFFRRKNKVK